MYTARARGCWESCGVLMVTFPAVYGKNVQNCIDIICRWLTDRRNWKDSETEPTCANERGPHASPRSGHINTLGWFLTTHWHGMTTFPMYTARARGCWESCGVLMVTFPRCVWKESTKLYWYHIQVTDRPSQLEGQRNRAHLCEWTGSPCIPQVRTHKHLGLIFNNTLTWNDHVSNVYSTCARMLGILRRLDGNISPLCMVKIYKTAIRSRMEYACAVWSGASTRSLQRLKDSFAKRLGLTLPPLKNRFNYHTLVLFYKIRQNLAPIQCKVLVFTSPRSFFHNIRLFISKIFLPCPPHKKVSNLGKFFTPSYYLMEWPSH